MRETRIAQASIFENYSNHEYGVRLRILDQHPEILGLVATDLIDETAVPVGRTGISAESVLRCLLLKQQLGVSYEQLASHLSDSMTYRTFTRLPDLLMSSRSALQATIRRVKPATLEQAHQVFTRSLLERGVALTESIVTISIEW